MSNFRVGQRVRIVCAESEFFGREGTIWMINHTPDWGPRAIKRGAKPSDVAYRVDVDGVGRDHLDCYAWIAYAYNDLRPLTDPAADQFIANLEKLSREPLIPLPEVEHEAK